MAMLGFMFQNWLPQLFIAGLGLVVYKLLLTRKKLVNFRGKYVLITGCGSGFGRAIALRLDEFGFRVIATCRTQKTVESLRDECSDKAVVMCLDVTNSEQITKVYEAVRNDLAPGEGLWGIINNAGIMLVGPIDWQPVERFKRVADVNLWGMIEVTKTFLPLVKQAKGRVVNMGSLLGKIAMPYMAAYSVSKFGVEAFSDALRREMRPWNVQVSVVAPGAHRTKLVDGKRLGEQLKDLWGGLNVNTRQEYGESCLQRGVEDFKLMDRITSTRINQIADSVLEALTAANPRARYEIGADTWVFGVVAWLPTVLSDWMLSFMAPLPRGSVSLSRPVIGPSLT